MTAIVTGDDAEAGRLVRLADGQNQGIDSREEVKHVKGIGPLGPFVMLMT